MSRPIVAIDCDLVLAASDIAWWKWLCRVTGSTYMHDIPHGEVEYDLSKYFRESLDKLKIDPLDFWRETGLYNWVNPVRGSIKAVEKIYKELSCDIVVVSAAKGYHSKSKWQFIQRHYAPYVDGVILTKEKHFVKCDYLIDDRNSHLNKMPEDVTCIRFDTPYIQDEEPPREILVARNWSEVLNIIEEKEVD